MSYQTYTAGKDSHSGPDPQPGLLSKIAKEKNVLSALSAKYAHALPGIGLTTQSLQQLGVSVATISRDYTGSKEEKEIATLELLAKKYESSGSRIFPGPAQVGGNSNPSKQNGDLAGDDKQATMNGFSFDNACLP
jgi:hypothetical protein